MTLLQYTNLHINVVLSFNFRLSSFRTLSSEGEVNFQSHSIFDNNDCLINKYK